MGFKGLFCIYFYLEIAKMMLVLVVKHSKTFNTVPYITLDVIVSGF